MPHNEIPSTKGINMSKHKTVKKSLIALATIAVVGFIANFFVQKRLDQLANG